MSKHEYRPYRPGVGFIQFNRATRLGIIRYPANPDYEGRHHLPEVRFSHELPDGAVYWSPNRMAFFRRDGSLPSGWVQRIYPRVAASFRTAE
ncbi:hypothetical protein Jasper_43 [Mycobacterium phage Jasper]|uniref:Uncharacterized protein n=2 Tax=Fromanvirus jasper TaxID=540065 RepID=B3VGT1_9CAUD|nr:hypothetical protein Jasper_43 [Mycobacterium phage Jasper]YP_009014032.1 hypothetical protein CL62_gp43 [Mycobacterium phage Dreamboat]ACE80058.1 hypothetical protein Jasper_43 [Mycobacterium phage Jasper]AEO94328.1 hypothetical protein DREAMBOAT_43 [Mycobacterium phage Dreamboat]